MYGQRSNIGFIKATTGITIASWWMWGVTIVLAVIATILLARVVLTVHSNKPSRRP